MMNKNNDPHYVARLEKAIAKRWGKDAVQNPRKFWDDEKEESYKKQLKELIDKFFIMKKKTFHFYVRNF